MNVLINGFHDHKQLSLVSSIRDMVLPGTVHCITVRNMADEMVAACPGIRTMCWEDLFWGGSLAASAIPSFPVDSAFLERMSRMEVLALKMMDRFEFLSDWNYGKRKQCYLDYVQFWHSYLIENRIELLISQNIPHEVFDFVLYSVATELHIPSLMFYQSQIKDMILPLKTYDGGIIGLASALKELPSDEQNPVLSDTLEEAIQDVLLNKKPFYMSKTPLFRRAQLFLNKAFSHVRDACILKKKSAITVSFRFKAWKRSVYLARKSRLLDRTYEKLAVKPDFSIPYFYVPLHYQPELTTCPLAGPWVDQELIVDLLSACLPEGVFIYVKEHPKQTALSRETDCYERISRHPNVRLVAKNTDSFELADHSIGVVTCTGTAGWEALIRGKPVLVFGNIFYETAPGAYRIRKREDLESALKEIATPGLNSPSLEGIRRFLHGLEKVTISGFVDPVYEQVSALNFEQSNANLAAYIRSYIGASGKTL